MPSKCFSVFMLGLWCSLVPAASECHAKNVVNPHARPLRSAYLLRDVAPFDPPAPKAIDEVQLIQRHFDTVLTILGGQKEDSLATTLDRLENRRQENWTDLERNFWSRYLEQRRDSQMTCLVEYRNRGVFPNNLISRQPIPIFVDRFNTACAVGHLMRLAGAGRLVDAIEENHNYVCIVDVTEGPLFDWILYSGLTQEEAALIQPGYSGLRSWPGCDGTEMELCFASDGTRKFVTLDALGGNETLSFGGLIESNDTYDARFSDFQSVRIESKIFPRTAEHVLGALLASMQLDENSGSLATALEYETGESIKRPLNGTQARFEPQEAIHIQTTVRIGKAGQDSSDFPETLFFSSMSHSFHVVPEPAVSYLSLLVVAVAVCKRKRRRNLAIRTDGLN